MILSQRLPYLVLLAVLTGAAIYVYVASIPPLYRANAIVSFERYGFNSTTGEDDLVDHEGGMAALALRSEALQSVIDTLALNMDVPTLQSFLNTIGKDNTGRVEIEATYNDPVLSAAIANEIAQQLLQLNVELGDDENCCRIQPAPIPAEPINLSDHWLIPLLAALTAALIAAIALQLFASRRWIKAVIFP